MTAQTRDRGPGRQRDAKGDIEPLFDPGKPPKTLFDEDAEKQAKQMRRINASQLRRFFSELKDLHRRFEAEAAAQPDRERIYRDRIEPQFKMLRSKVRYATRAGGQSKVPDDFAKFLSEGIRKVENAEQFRLFVMHVEAVVGFMYGEGKVTG